MDPEPELVDQAVLEQVASELAAADQEKVAVETGGKLGLSIA